METQRNGNFCTLSNYVVVNEVLSAEYAPFFHTSDDEYGLASNR